MSDLPSKITVMWTKTYDVKEVIKEIADFDGIDESEITDDDVTEYVRVAAANAFESESSDPELFYLDEEGDILSI